MLSITNTQQQNTITSATTTTTKALKQTKPTNKFGSLQQQIDRRKVLGVDFWYGGGRRNSGRSPRKNRDQQQKIF